MMEFLFITYLVPHALGSLFACRKITKMIEFKARVTRGYHRGPTGQSGLVAAAT